MPIAPHVEETRSTGAEWRSPHGAPRAFGPEPPPRPTQGEPSEEPPPRAESGNLIGRCDLERDLEMLLTQALREAEGSDSLILVEECSQLREECQQLMSRSLATSRSLQALSSVLRSCRPNTNRLFGQMQGMWMMRVLSFVLPVSWLVA